MAAAGARLATRSLIALALLLQHAHGACRLACQKPAPLRDPARAARATAVGKKKRKEKSKIKKKKKDAKKKKSNDDDPR